MVNAPDDRFGISARKTGAAECLFTRALRCRAGREDEKTDIVQQPASQASCGGHPHCGSQLVRNGCNFLRMLPEARSFPEAKSGPRDAAKSDLWASGTPRRRTASQMPEFRSVDRKRRSWQVREGVWRRQDPARRCRRVRLPKHHRNGRAAARLPPRGVPGSLSGGWVVAQGPMSSRSAEMTSSGHGSASSKNSSRATRSNCAS